MTIKIDAQAQTSSHKLTHTCEILQAESNSVARFMWKKEVSTSSHPHPTSASTISMRLKPGAAADAAGFGAGAGDLADAGLAGVGVGACKYIMAAAT